MNADMRVVILLPPSGTGHYEQDETKDYRNLIQRTLHYQLYIIQWMGLVYRSICAHEFECVQSVGS